MVIVGDDQHELFGADGVPAIGLFTGERVDYIPAYRSPAGTGVGMAFATWNRDRAARTEQETAV